MNILQITPAERGSKSGNRTTARRWAQLLRNLGHRVTTATSYNDEAADLLIALHAWRSRAAIARYHALFPDRPLIVALTGTDINDYIKRDPEPTLNSLKVATALVCFHDLVRDITPVPFRHKLHVIYQSAQPLVRKPARRHFDVCVIGHLREVKDPLRTAHAVRDLPPTSKIRVNQLGKALDPKLRKAATAEMPTNPSYRWLGEVPGWRVRRELSRTRLMVISSLAEGGANVISEAVVAGVPVIASAIAGNIGLLGRDYAGYYPAGDTQSLRALLLQAENSPAFLTKLERQCAARRHLFTREAEQASWRKLIKQL
ncbi:MAG: Glycos transf 1 protein [Gammaproteobacteria bacterium]|nr:Glycos transf 1 protein [Gammaproteobacteria bacterium]